MSHDLKALRLVAEQGARSVGKLLAHYSSPSALSSIGKDIKLDVDKEAHGILIECLGKTGIPILSEEDEVHNFGLTNTWVIDPLDGSFNFFRGMPICAVSIALVHGGEPVLGVVYDFKREEMFVGIPGDGAWCNGKEIRVSQIGEQKNAVVATGFPSYTNFATNALLQYVSFAQNFKKVRNLGSASLSLAYVACGRADAYYEKDIRIWDVAAGLALVKAAGGNYEKTGLDKAGKCTVSADNNLLLTNHK